MVIAYISSNNYSFRNQSRFKIIPTLMSFSHQHTFLNKMGRGEGETVQLVSLHWGPSEPHTPHVPLASCFSQPVLLEFSTHRNSWGPREGRELAKSAHVHGSMSGLCTGLIKSLGPETRLKIAALGMVTKEPAWKLCRLLGAWWNRRALYKGGRQEKADGSSRSFWKKGRCKQRARTEKSKTMLYDLRGPATPHMPALTHPPCVGCGGLVDDKGGCLGSVLGHFLGPSWALHWAGSAPFTWLWLQGLSDWVSLVPQDFHPFFAPTVWAGPVSHNHSLQDHSLSSDPDSKRIWRVSNQEKILLCLKACSVHHDRQVPGRGQHMP